MIIVEIYAPNGEKEQFALATESAADEDGFGRAANPIASCVLPIAARLFWLRHGLVVKGMQTIDVSSVGAELFGIDHDVFASKSPLIDDVARLIASGVRPPRAVQRSLLNVIARIASMPPNAALRRS